MTKALVVATGQTVAYSASEGVADVTQTQGGALNVNVVSGGGGGGGGGAITAAAGSYSAGALVDGADVTQGTQADAAYTGSGAASVISLLKGAYAAQVAPLPAGTNALGSVSITGTTAVSGSVSITGTAAISGTVADSTLAAGMVAQGGATAAANALQTAGVYNSGTLTLTTGQGAALQLTASGFLRTQDQGLNTAQGAAVTGVTGAMVMGEATSTAPSFTNSTLNPLTTDLAGQLRVTLGGANNTSAFTAPSGGATATISPVAIGAFTSSPNALTNGQSSPIALTPTSAQYVDTESLKASYILAGTVVLAATPTDVVVIPGSASKTIRIKRIRIFASATTAGQMTLTINKHSTANAGGTSTSPTPLPLDSNFSASSITPLVYTANPTTIGTVTGPADVALLDFGVGAAGPIYDRTFGAENASSLGVRAVAQSMAINLNGGTVPTGAVFVYNVEWTEE